MKRRIGRRREHDLAMQEDSAAGASRIHPAKTEAHSTNLGSSKSQSHGSGVRQPNLRPIDSRTTSTDPVNSILLKRRTCAAAVAAMTNHTPLWHGLLLLQSSFQLQNHLSDHSHFRISNNKERRRPSFLQWRGFRSRFLLCLLLLLSRSASGQDLQTQQPQQQQPQQPPQLTPRPINAVVTTANPVSPAPTTAAPETRAPESSAPVTGAPVSGAPAAVATATNFPTMPSNNNTAPTSAPTSAPPSTASPTGAPTPVPSANPTMSSAPTLSRAPSSNPTVTGQPSSIPSDLPTTTPTTEELMTVRGFFVQNFDADFFNESEIGLLEEIYTSYTDDFAPGAGVITICELSISEQSRVPDTVAPNSTLNEISFQCTYESRVVSVEDFPARFVEHLNGKLPNLVAQMQARGLRVEGATKIIAERPFSPMPTMSSNPSTAPSNFPSLSTIPSMVPTIRTTELPTSPPRIMDVPSIAPSPLLPSGGGLSTGATAGIVILCGLAMLAGLFCYYRAWQKKHAADGSPTNGGLSAATSIGASRRTFGRHSSSALMSHNSGYGMVNGNSGGVWPNSEEAPDPDDLSNRNVVLSPTESLLSNKSLVSAGESGLGDESGEEADGTKNLQDEFDQYKDQNLEQLRVDVEGNLAGFEGIMSAAVTNALMGNEETHVDTQELLWGCDPNPKGTEIEASALFEVCDWLKRNESAFGERKRAFMQEILNKMVTSVRYGVLDADVASRTIHEAAAILNLPLVEELPSTTVLISGMRKTATADDMIKALREFGDVDFASVASGRRGFGIVRFRRQKSVERALQRYRSGEIVILDVSIQMKVLQPSGDVESR